MNHLIPGRRWLLALALCVGLPFGSAPAADGDADDRAIRDVTERFVARFAARDFDGLKTLFSEKFVKYLAPSDAIDVKSLAIVWVRRRGDVANVRFRVGFVAPDVGVGKPWDFEEKWDGTLQLRARLGAGKS